jgi:hypothetical protein
MNTVSRRGVTLAALLGAAVGVPYFATQPQNGTGKGSSASTEFGAAGSLSPLLDSNPRSGAAQSPLDMGRDRRQRIGDVPLEGVPVYDLADVLRLDVTSAWVYSRWSRKSTALSDLQLHGVRVPLVTGTDVDDLAGSLTYYFNPAGKVQRISFRGRTGDTRKLVTLLIKEYGFRMQTPEISGEQLYQVLWNARPISELRIRPAPVIWASAPHASFEVELELERPGSGRFLSG